MPDLLTILIENILWENPDRVFELIDKSGGNLDEVLEKFRELRMGRLIAKERFPELADVKIEQAVDFVFWLSYWMEREIRDDIFFIQTSLGQAQDEIEKILDEMNFGAKIKFLEDNYIEKGKNEYIEMLREVKKLRNYMSHGELDKLTYAGHHLSDPRGQIKLIVNLRNVTKSKGK